MAIWEAWKQMVGIVALEWQKSEQTTIAKIVVISRVWSSCLQSCQSWLDPRKQTQRAPHYRTRLPALPKQDKQANGTQSTTCKAQTIWCKDGMLCGMRCGMHMQDLTRNAWTWPQLGNPSVPLERWDEIDWKRYKERRNRSYGLEMASNSNMTTFCDLQQVAI